MDGRCATCRHWQTFTKTGQRLVDKPLVWDEAANRWAFEYETYEYEDIRHDGWRRCVKLTEGGETPKLYTYDEPCIETAPDFGCVLWSAREEG